MNTDTLRDKIYQIVDSFLAEAKDQHGNDRSLERLNQDRHLAVDSIFSHFEDYKSSVREAIKKHEMSYVWNNGECSFCGNFSGEEPHICQIKNDMVEDLLDNPLLQ